MTSAQPMRFVPRAIRLVVIVPVMFVTTVMHQVGCQSGERLVAPTRLTAPYAEPRTWAVVPFANESGISTIDIARLADLFTNEIEEVHGLRTVPVNRVITAMRALNLAAVTSPQEATALMNALNVDGVLVGTVTTWDAFPPLRVGMAVELFQRSPSDPPVLDPRELLRSPTGSPLPAEADRQSLSASGVFDAANHDVRASMQAYARGRHVPDSAFGPRIYEMRMELFTQFVSHRLTADLLAQQAQRQVQAGQTVAQTDAPR